MRILFLTGFRKGGLMAVKAIFFDIDDTLCDRISYATDCFRAILTEYSGIDDPVLLEAVVQDCMLWDEFGNISKDHITGMLEKTYGIVLPIDNFPQYWVDRQWQYCIPFAETAETLLQLSGKYRLGVISNGPGVPQRMKLKQAGLDHFFSAENIIVSGDYDFQKPDPRLFLEACRILKVRPEESVHVGDLYGRDVIGALKAGMQAVWINSQTRRKGGENVLKINKISDLLEYF